MSETQDTDYSLGATLTPSGAMFRLWAPSADAVSLVAVAPGASLPAGWVPADGTVLAKAADGVWSGLVPGVQDGWEYRFWTSGPGGSGFKRDPRARELAFDGYPDCNCIVRGPDSYPWHDAGFAMPAFNDLIIYQLHFGVFYARDEGADIRHDRVSKFLDAAGRIAYLAALGVNAIEPLPIAEWQGEISIGYNNTDFFSPEMDYTTASGARAPYLTQINAMLAQKGFSPIRDNDIADQRGQLKAFVDLCHVYGMAVIGDVVYNHAGEPFDDQSMRFLSHPANHQDWDPDDYFIANAGWAGGRIFDFARPEVNQFLIDNARSYYEDFHFDGLRYDEVTEIHRAGGDGFCRDVTATLRYDKPRAIQIAEYWDGDHAYAVQQGGLGFDASWDDRLRDAVRGVLQAAAGGAAASLQLDPIRDAMRRPDGFAALWQSVTQLENHDLVRVDAEPVLPRIAAAADASDHRSWYARSRSRVATGLLLTAPGIPMLFMGQEFLEDKPWSENPGRDDCFIWWDGLDGPTPDPAMQDFARFTRDLCWLRRRQPGLRGEGCDPYYGHDGDRVMAVHRWVEGAGRDVLLVASFNEATYWSYQLPLPVGGHWLEVFNSDAYDSLPAGGGYNPWAAGNPGGIDGVGPALAGCPVSAVCVLPGNGIVVFARDTGDGG